MTETWTITKLLDWTTDYFKKAQIEWPHLEAEILLAHSLGLKRIELYTQHERALSKEELALKVKQYVPNFYIHFAPIGSDPDKRNYIVSNQRLREAGFEAKRSLDDGIQELIRGYRMIGRQQFKNV